MLSTLKSGGAMNVSFEEFWCLIRIYIYSGFSRTRYPSRSLKSVMEDWKILPILNDFSNICQNGLYALPKLAMSLHADALSALLHVILWCGKCWEIHGGILQAGFWGYAKEHYQRQHFCLVFFGSRLGLCSRCTKKGKSSLTISLLSMQFIHFESS